MNNEEQKILGYYDYTVILTYIGIFTGLIGLSFVMKDAFQNAAVCLMISGACDMFDGAIANTKARTPSEKKFGIQIDSLSDLICFGVLPAMFVYRLNGSGTLSFGVACGYVLCALIRLAYFNVSEEERQSSELTARKIYYGLPVTTAALFVPALYALTEKGEYSVILLMIMGILFLTPFKIKKPKIIGKLVLAAMGLFEFGFIILGVLADV